MATFITSAFMDKVLAPIPASEEQADTKQYRAQITRDMMRVWRAGMRSVEVAKARQVVATATFKDSGERYATDCTPCALSLQATMAIRQAIELQQCLIPAPRAVDMRWKKRLIRYWSTVPDDIVAAIARDEARFTEGR